MKKLVLLFLIIMLSACTNNSNIEKNKTLQELLDEISISEEISSDIELPTSYKLNDEVVIAIWESSNINILSNTGILTRPLGDSEITLSLTLISSTESLSKDFKVKVLKVADEDVINAVLDKLNVPSSTKVNINLQQNVTLYGQRFTIVWSTSNSNAITNSGKVGLIEKDAEATLTAKVTYNNLTLSKDFPINIIALNNDEKAEYIFNSLGIPKMTSTDLNLKTVFDFNLTGVWTSTDQNIISNTGKVNTNLQGNKKVSLTLTLSNGIGRTFEVTVSQNNHLVIDRTFEGSKQNVVIKNGKLTLAEGATTGTYESDIIETLSFNELVGSWASTSSKNATVNFSVRVRVNNTWSKYFSYGEWGFGNSNRSVDTSDTIAKLSTDEIKILNSKTADAIQFKVVLTRTSTTVDAPQTSLLAAALNIPGYTNIIDISNIDKTKIYDVPQLYQHVVPTIGDSICSPTSATMLLKYLGVDLKNQPDNNYTYEHEYIARRVYDHGNSIFGNWVYNTVGISSFGFDSYVMRMYSYQELLVHLYENGPISASIKGTVNVEKGKDYTTNGHLIVVKGYRIEGDQIYIVINDPNLSNVDDEMKLQNFLNVWRNVAYIV